MLSILLDVIYGWLIENLIFDMKCRHCMTSKVRINSSPVAGSIIWGIVGRISIIRVVFKLLGVLFSHGFADNITWVKQRLKNGMETQLAPLPLWMTYMKYINLAGIHNAWSQSESMGIGCNSIQLQLLNYQHPFPFKSEGLSRSWSEINNWNPDYEVSLLPQYWVVFTSRDTMYVVNDSLS